MNWFDYLVRNRSEVLERSVEHLGLVGASMGIALLIGFFASYLTALSWADLTFVLPATAFGNVIVALFARFWIHEAISWQRWLGVVLITVGVGFVAHGPSLTVQPTASDSISETPALQASRFTVTTESALEKEQVR